MFDRTQWFLAGMSIILSVQLSQPVAAAVPVGKVVQTVQSNSNEAAEKAFKEGLQLYQQGTAESLKGAIVKYEEALKLYRTAGDRRREALTLNNIGTVYLALGENQKALEYLSQSLHLRQAIGNRRGEIITLNNIGQAYLNLGEKQKALEYTKQSLSLLQTLDNRAGEATIVHNIGLAYYDLGEIQKALEYYNKSLPLSRAVGDRRQEALTLRNMGHAYYLLEGNQKALEYYSQSLPLFQAVGDRKQETVALNNIGKAYSELGEKQKALEYYSQALALSGVVGDLRGEALTLYNIADVKRNQNNLIEALNDIESAIKILENLRSIALSPEVRNSYLAPMQENYEFYIDLLMQLHQANPNSGYDVKASEARKRASNL